MATSVFSVQSNIAETVRDLLNVGVNVRQKATVRTLNEIAALLRTRASRRIRQTGYGLKAARIKKALVIKKATPSKLTAELVASGRPVPLIEFDARPVAGGVSVKVLNGRRLVKGAFIATMPGGHQGVYIDVPGAKHRWVVKNGKRVREQLPIKQLFGPAVPDAMANVAVGTELQRLVDERFEPIMRRNIAFYAK